MSSAFREENHHEDNPFRDDNPFHDSNAVQNRQPGDNHPDTSHATAANGDGARSASANANANGEPLTNVSTAETDDHIVNRPVRRELTREKVSRAAKEGKAWGISHVKNKWKWYLVGLIVFLAILLPIVFLVALPAIVQLIVNQQNLPVMSGALNVLDPNTIKVTLDSAFKIPKGLSAKTNEFALQLYDKGAPEFSPFLQIMVGPLKLNGGSTNFSVKDQVQPVTNQESLTDWFATFYDQSTVDLSVRGTDAEISLGALKSKPRLDKTITMAGLRKFSGINIQKLNFLFPPKANGNNIQGDLMLPNYSPMALSFGTIDLELTSGDLKVGKLTLADINIEPGNHTQSFEGVLDLNTVISNLSGFLGSQSKALGEGNLQLNATAKSVELDGAPIKFIEDVLKTRPLTVDISIVTVATDLISGLLKSGGQISGDGPSNGTSFIDVISGVLGNQTLLSGIQGHWTKHAKRSPSIHDRSLLGDNMMWNLMKLGLKMKSMKK